MLPDHISNTWMLIRHTQVPALPEDVKRYDYTALRALQHQRMTPHTFLWSMDAMG